MPEGTLTLFIITWLLFGVIGVAIGIHEGRKCNGCIIIFIIIAFFLPKIVELLK